MTPDRHNLATPGREGCGFRGHRALSRAQPETLGDGDKASAEAGRGPGEQVSDLPVLGSRLGTQRAGWDPVCGGAAQGLPTPGSSMAWEGGQGPICAGQSWWKGLQQLSLGAV